MLEMRRPYLWSEPEKKARPTHPDNVKPRTDAYTEAQRLKRGHGFIPSELRPQDELDEEERTKAPKTFVPIEDIPDTGAMNPEEALLVKEEGGEENVHLGVASQRKKMYDKIAKEFSDSGLVEILPTNKLSNPKAYKIDIRRIESSGQQSTSLKESKGAKEGKLTKKEVRDMAHGRKGPGGSGSPRRQGRASSAIENRKWEEKLKKQGEQKELKRYTFFKEWMEELNNKIRIGKFGRNPESVRFQVERELERAALLFDDVYKKYEISISSPSNEVIYKIKSWYRGKIS